MARDYFFGVHAETRLDRGSYVERLLGPRGLARAGLDRARPLAERSLIETEPSIRTLLAQLVDVSDPASMPSAYFLAIRAVVNGEDPVGLLGAGAPVDEYDPEVTVLVEQGSPVDAQRVHDVFTHNFGDVGAISIEAAENIAVGASRARREHLSES